MGCAAGNVSVEVKAEKTTSINRKFELFSLKGEVIADIKSESSPSQRIELLFFLKEGELARYELEISQKIDDVEIDIGKSITFEGTDIDFTVPYGIEYFFEKDQILRMKLCKNEEDVELITYSLGKLMGAPGQTTSIPLDKGNFVIRAVNIKDDNFEAEIKVQLYARNKSQNLEPYFYLKRDCSSGDTTYFVNAYKSEVLNNQINNIYDFGKIVLKTLYLNTNDNKIPFMIEFHDAITKAPVGFQFPQVDTFSRLNGFRNKYILTSSADKKPMDYEITITITLNKLYRFIDYLRGGLQISLIVGIDFTSSNKQIEDPESHHHLSDGSHNAYEKAINACGRIVSYYDYDQMFPVFGLGAVLPGDENVNHCFPVNFKTDPQVYTIAGISKAYRDCLAKIKLYGPTYFGPIIKKAIDISNSTSSNKDVYYILMILTDGLINDMGPTVELLVQASNLPISIIIVGVGDGNFADMEHLDADKHVLLNAKGVKANRDLVQFVEFRKYENNGVKLAEEVLAEIPTQLETYFKAINKPPNHPINLNL